ncbi:MAG: acetate--CoA ligase family protein, partial [Alphaproteobacteria bacterium]
MADAVGVRDDSGESAAEASRRKVGALVAPGNIVIVGASDRANNWSLRVWRNLKRYEYPHPVYPLNPRRETVWDVPCYPDFASLPEPPDHVVVVVPAPHVPDILEEAAAAGARSATVFSSGFEEAPHEEGQALGRRLREVIARTGIALSGPNCLGNMIAKSKLVTMTDDRQQNLIAGPVAVLGQSGGLVMAIKRTLEDRGIPVGYLLTCGNESGLCAADYIHYFATEPDIKVIVCYLESVKSPQAFLEASRAAREAGKPVVVVKLGGSEEGRAAAAAHTGALAGAFEAFDAVAGAAGVVRVNTMDDVIETVELFLHAPLPGGAGLGAITLSGGFRGMLLDGADANGMKFSDISPETATRLADILGVGTIIGNPLDAGFAALSSQDALFGAIDVLLDDPAIDILLLQEEVPRHPGVTSKESNLRRVNQLVADGVTKPIAFCSMISYAFTDYARELRSGLGNVPFVQEVDKSLRAVRSVAAYAESARLAKRTVQAPPALAETDAIRALRNSGGGALDEVASKAILRDCGVAAPDEAVAANVEEAAKAAASIGYPVVLKAISAEITHKSDAGAVRIGLAGEDDLRAAWDGIAASVESYRPGAKIDGMLVAPMISGGLELALGIQNDPDMGCVVMFGSGGVLLELYKDAAFGPPGLDAEIARAMIARTRAGTLIEGYRGSPAMDCEAVVEALVALGRLARDFGDLIEAVDVNPFVVLEAGKGGYA